jgi:hypothetical protein
MKKTSINTGIRGEAGDEEVGVPESIDWIISDTHF